MPWYQAVPETWGSLVSILVVLCHLCVLCEVCSLTGTCAQLKRLKRFLLRKTLKLLSEKVCFYGKIRKTGFQVSSASCEKVKIDLLEKKSWMMCIMDFKFSLHSDKCTFRFHFLWNVPKRVLQKKKYETCTYSFYVLLCAGVIKILLGEGLFSCSLAVLFLWPWLWWWEQKQALSLCSGIIGCDACLLGLRSSELESPSLSWMWQFCSFRALN